MADVNGLAASQQLLYTLYDPTVVQDFSLEVVGINGNYDPPIVENYSTEAVAFGGYTPPVLHNYSMEIVAKDAGFIPPTLLNATAGAQQLLAIVPNTRTVNSYTTEVIANGITTIPLKLYNVEVVGGLPYSVSSNSYVMEAIDVSTINPPQANQRAVWFITT